MPAFGQGRAFTYKKDFHEQDNHNGVITHLEPDILECEVKWALGSITMNKVSGGNGIPVELFQILKDDGMKVLCSVCQQIWKTQQWPKDWKWSVFIPIPKKGNAKEYSNYAQLRSEERRVGKEWWWVIMNCPLKQGRQNSHTQILDVPDTQLAVNSDPHGKGVRQLSPWPPVFALTSDRPARTGAVKFPKLCAGEEGPPCTQQSFTF